MAGPGLAEMLRDGGAPPMGPQGPGGPPEPDQDDAGGSMPPEQAIQVMQKFGITPDDLPMLAAAISTLLPLMQGQGGQGVGA